MRAAGAVSSQWLRRCHSQETKGGPTSGNVLELVSTLLCCAYASCFTGHESLLTEQAVLLSTESLFRQQASGPSCANTYCYTPAPSLRKLDTTSQSWLGSLNTQGVTGYRCVCLSLATRPRRGIAVSLVSRSQTCWFYRRFACATNACCASEAVHTQVCRLSCDRKDRRLNTKLRFALVERSPFKGPRCRELHIFPVLIVWRGGGPYVVHNPRFENNRLLQLPIAQ